MVNICGQIGGEGDKTSKHFVDVIYGALLTPRCTMPERREGGENVEVGGGKL